MTTEPTVGEVTYLPHRAVIKENRSTTKVRVVFDCSVKNKNGHSLNNIVYGLVLILHSYCLMCFYVFASERFC